MKYLYLTLLFLFLTVATSAQNLSNSSDLSVLQKKWHKRTKSQASVSEDPFRAISETNKTIENRKAELRDNAVRQNQGLPPEPPRSSTIKREVPARDISLTSYIYRIKVQNKGTKTIQSIAWEYVFFNPTTKREVGRLKFLSKTNLKPGKTDNLVMSSPNPPSVVIQAEDKDRYVEQVNIKRIQYMDGSVWEANSK